MLVGRKRIMVVGSGGAGKSTFSRALGEITKLPVIHLDYHNWRPGWVPTPTQEWRAQVENLAAGEEWIIDGNYGGTLATRVKRCDAIVFFDFNRFTCLWGVVKRFFFQRGKPRPDMGEGCPERLDWAFIRWVWGYRKTSRFKVVHAIDLAEPDVRIVTVKTRYDVRNLLKAVCESSA